VNTLAVDVRGRASSELPEWMHRYADVLTPNLRSELAVWRAATGVRPDDRTLAGPTPSDDREGTYHRRLTRTVNARYGEALKVWEARILDYVGHRDESTSSSWPRSSTNSIGGASTPSRSSTSLPPASHCPPTTRPRLWRTGFESWPRRSASGARAASRPKRSNALPSSRSVLH